MKPAVLVITVAALVTPPALAQAQSWHSVQRNNEPVVTGSGRIVTQNRPISDFHSIELRGFGNVDVRLGSAPTLSVTADDNLLPFLTSEVQGGTLVLDTRGSLRTRSTPRVAITVPNLDQVMTKGSGNIRLDRVNNQRLILVSHGSGNFTANGRTGTLDVRIHGSGNADARALASARADVRIHGSGSARVMTNGALDAQIFGSGSVLYAGNPRPLSVSRHGSGSVRPAGR